MHHLFDGNSGYSQEAILKTRSNPAVWEFMRGEVVKLLRGSLYNAEAAEALANLPLELWEATNNFGDQFSVLYMKLPVDRFIKLAREADGEMGQRKYLAISDAMQAKGERIRFISMDYAEDDGSDVASPDLKATSVSVELALENLSTLLQHSKRGPTSAVDRIHTALHAHLLYLCSMAGHTADENAGLESLFTLLRTSRPDPDTQSDKIFRGLAKVIDALSPIRNKSSLAHPSETLLEEPEAMLALNAGRTLLRYLDSRFTS